MQQEHMQSQLSALATVSVLQLMLLVIVGAAQEHDSTGAAPA